METIKINGMKCPHCSGSVTKALEAIAGLSEISIDLDKGEASYNNGGQVARQIIIDAIAKAGFEPMG